MTEGGLDALCDEPACSFCYRESETVIVNNRNSANIPTTARACQSTSVIAKRQASRAELGERPEESAKKRCEFQRRGHT